MGGVVGQVFHFVFFIAFTAAAFTSSVSLLEVVTDYLIEQHGMVRKNAVILCTVLMAVMTTLASLSQGPLAHVQILGAGFFDIMDLLSDKVYMAIGGLLLCIAVGWAMPTEAVYNEITNNGTIPFGLFKVWHFLIRFIIPILVAIVSITGIISVPQRGIMIVGLISIVIMAIFSKKMK